MNRASFLSVATASLVTTRGELSRALTRSSRVRFPKFAPQFPDSPELAVPDELFVTPGGELIVSIFSTSNLLQYVGATLARIVKATAHGSANVFSASSNELFVGFAKVGMPTPGPSSQLLKIDFATGTSEDVDLGDLQDTVSPTCAIRSSGILFICCDDGTVLEARQEKVKRVMSKDFSGSFLGTNHLSQAWAMNADAEVLCFSATSRKLTGIKLRGVGDSANLLPAPSGAYVIEHNGGRCTIHGLRVEQNAIEIERTRSFALPAPAGRPFVDAAGCVWLPHESSISRISLDSNRISEYAPVDASLAGCAAIAADGKGTIWTITDDALSTWHV